jgi:hypothetical protein
VKSVVVFLWKFQNRNSSLRGGRFYGRLRARMMTVKLSSISICLGLAVAVWNLFGVFQPGQFAAAMRKFPRSLPWGYLLTLGGACWFIWNVKQESLADFESIKPVLFTLFIGVALGSCVFVQDFLAVRGLSIVLLLLGKLMVDSERWAGTEWRLVIAAWAYVMVLAGMWFTISPWKLRDLIYWATANPSRTRLLTGVKSAFGLFVAVLGFTVF